MYDFYRSPQFCRDTKACVKRHWEMDAFEKALFDLQRSDERPLDAMYDAHALTGNLRGKMAVHIPSRKRPPRGSWVLMYEIDEDCIVLYRTGAHDIY